MSEPSKKTDVTGPVALAVASPDPATIIRPFLDFINVTATAVSLVSPRAALVIRTLAFTSGWIVDKVKADRVGPALVAIAKRLEESGTGYVHKEEFPDLLWDAFKRMGDQPDPQRLRILNSILTSAIDKPRDYTENRQFLRLADELPSVALKMLVALSGPYDEKEQRLSHGKMLARRVGVSDEVGEETYSDLESLRLIDREKRTVFVPAGNNWETLLTSTGRAFLMYCREAG